MGSLKIIFLSIAAGVLYGIIHDQITVRVCIKYFTVFHPRVISSDSPTLLGLVWRVIATWWTGAFLGTWLAVAARAGRKPTINASDLIRPIAKLLAVMAVSALFAGCLGYVLPRQGVISAPPWMLLSPERPAVFMADWWAHSASYATAFLGGMVLCIATYRRRAALSARVR
jgi:hypothetical protein